jgi:hypothetical protein
MPLARYFTVVGSLLLALLFLGDWYFPKLTAPPATAGVDKTIIRLHSAHKWPEAIVFDTTAIPMLAAEAEVPPAPTLPLNPSSSPRQAFAMAQPAPVVASPKAVPKRILKPRTRVAHAVRGQSYQIVGFRDFSPWGSW